MQKANYVFVIDNDEIPQAPVHSAVARKLQRDGLATRHLTYPYTIKLKRSGDGPLFTPNLRLKIDPGSKETGLALLNADKVIWVAELEHRGYAIKKKLKDRRSYRSKRRCRNTQYRETCFNNRKNHDDWFQPSLDHRVLTTLSWVSKLARVANIKALSVEDVRFDMQLMENPDISGVEYQQGTLQGETVRGYLLTKWNYRCAYCNKKDRPFEIEHVIPKAKGGTNRISNLVIACVPCNKRKADKDLAVFLKQKPKVLKRVKAQLKIGLKDAAVVNSTRNRLREKLIETGIPVETGSGGMTTWNRKRYGMDKTHWLDAACVGESTPYWLWFKTTQPLKIKCMGHGNRRVTPNDKYGFPNGKPSRLKRYFKEGDNLGITTGDIVKVYVPNGKYKGLYRGRMSGVKSTGAHNFKSVNQNDFGLVKKAEIELLQRNDGYQYSFKKKKAA